MRNDRQCYGSTHSQFGLAIRLRDRILCSKRHSNALQSSMQCNACSVDEFNIFLSNMFAFKMVNTRAKHRPITNYAHRIFPLTNCQFTFMNGKWTVCRIELNYNLIYTERTEHRAQHTLRIFSEIHVDCVLAVCAHIYHFIGRCCRRCKQRHRRHRRCHSNNYAFTYVSMVLLLA